MTRRWLLLALGGTTFLFLFQLTCHVPACCPVPPAGKPVVNADQTIIIVWEAATKTEHFIRQASFKSQAQDFGFLVPTPNQPELNESGNTAFPYLQKLTEPERLTRPRPKAIACACGAEAPIAYSVGESNVRVLEEKFVGGFKAVVLEARSANDLMNWLKENGYVFSPEAEAWAKPYVDAGWKITALKVAKAEEGKENKTVTASALRMSFKTDRPLFPYREPDFKGAAQTLGAADRLLRIYFLAESRYQGELTREVAWPGQVAWANKIKPEERRKVLEELRLPENTGPAECWLTEFEDHWPYRVAPADLYFSTSLDQNTVKRPPIIEYASAPWPTDVMVYAIACVVMVPPLFRRIRRGRCPGERS